MKNNWNSYLKKRVEGVQDSKRTPPASSSVTYQERLTRRASSDPSELVKSSLDGNLSNEPAGTVAAPAPVRPCSPVFPKVMFLDWLDTSLMSLGLDASFLDVNWSSATQGLNNQASVQVDGPCGTVDSLHGIDDDGILWGFHGAEDQMDVQGGGPCDLLSVNEFLGIN